MPHLPQPLCFHTITGSLATCIHCDATQDAPQDRSDESSETPPAVAPSLGELEPADKILNDVQGFVRRFVVLNEAQTTSVTLWIAHTHAIGAFERLRSLRLRDRRSDAESHGCSTCSSWSWRGRGGRSSPSEAVLFRKIDAVAPTLLLDETDAIFNALNGNTEPLRALLNAGNRRGTSVPRCVGPTHQLVDFEIFCAKALAGIGDLPDTVADRASRSGWHASAGRAADDSAAAKHDGDAEPLRRALASWAQAARDDLEVARPALPSALDDRAEEAWEPLLAIADLAGGDWPEQGTTCGARALAGEEATTTRSACGCSPTCADIFGQHADRLSSAALLDGAPRETRAPWRATMRGQAAHGASSPGS